MDIHIVDEAVKWYKDEMNVSDGDFIRFYVRYGGISTIQQGFSLGISKEEPEEIGAFIKKDGIFFYVEQKDLWYFDNHNFYIQFHSTFLEPEFCYATPSNNHPY